MLKFQGNMSLTSCNGPGAGSSVGSTMSGNPPGGPARPRPPRLPFLPVFPVAPLSPYKIKNEMLPTANN